jgi:small subunit ribosomal protein S18
MFGEYRRRKVDWFLENKIEFVDYRNERILRRFINERGKILPRRITGCTAENQRKLTTAIKRARILAILPFESETYR